MIPHKEVAYCGERYFEHIQSISGISDWWQFLRYDLRNFINHDFTAIDPPVEIEPPNVQNEVHLWNMTHPQEQ